MPPTSAVSNSHYPGMAQVQGYSGIRKPLCFSAHCGCSIHYQLIKFICRWAKGFFVNMQKHFEKFQPYPE